MRLNHINNKTEKINYVVLTQKLGINSITIYNILNFNV